MRPPRWMTMTMQRDANGRAVYGEDGHSVMYTLRVNKWHPGWWLFVLRVWLGRHR